MRKILSTLLLILICISFSSCSGANNARKVSNEKSEEIVRCFDEKDIEGLKSLFCLNSQNNYNLDKEIEKAFSLYNGKSISYNLSYGGTAGGWDDGERIDEHITPSIRDIETSNGNIYNIYYTEYTIYKADSGRVGIIYMSLFDSEDNTLARISWPK